MNKSISYKCSNCQSPLCTPSPYIQLPIVVPNNILTSVRVRYHLNQRYNNIYRRTVLVNFNQSNITDIDINAFDNLYMITRIALDNNNITTILSNTFTDLENLETIWLNDNHISDI
jgi:hypothetical protein